MAFSLKAKLGGGGGLQKLAAEPGTILRDKSISLSGPGAEQLVLALSGKFCVSGLALTRGPNSAAGDLIVRMIVDGEEVWNASLVLGAVGGTPQHLFMFGVTVTSLGSGTMSVSEPPFVVENSLQLFITLPAGTTTTTLQYCARPIK